MVRLVLTGFAALLGLAFGSFLNVCLTRWPEGESVVAPRSHCRQCNRTLTWWENVPLVSWLALGGRCRTCKTAIGWRYPLVELAVGGLWGIACSRLLDNVYQHHKLTPHALIATIAFASLCWLAVGLAVLDAEYLWLPNLLTWPGMLIGLIYTVASSDLLWPAFTEGSTPRIFAGRFTLIVFDRLFAAAIAAGLVLLIRWTYRLIRKQEGMGLGDAKLMAMLAAWLGLSDAVLSFVLAVCMGAAFAFVILAQPKARRGAESWATTALPFGTFLCIGGIVASLWGQQIISIYLRWSGLR